MKQKLCNNKERQSPLTTAGIYEISCLDCDSKYIGQSRRAIMERFKEHKSATVNGYIERSSVAEHMIVEGHSLDDTPKRVKNVLGTNKLDAWESLFITNSCSQLMNREPPPISSYLFTLTDMKIR